MRHHLTAFVTGLACIGMFFAATPQLASVNGQTHITRVVQSNVGQPSNGQATSQSTAPSQAIQRLQGERPLGTSSEALASSATSGAAADKHGDKGLAPSLMTEEGRPGL